MNKIIESLKLRDIKILVCMYVYYVNNILNISLKKNF